MIGVFFKKNGKKLSSIIEVFPHIATYPISLIGDSIPTDNKTESFIIGFGSLGFGSCFLAQSGLIQCLQNRIWSDQTKEQNNINWAMAGVGGLCLPSMDQLTL